MNQARFIELHEQQWLLLEVLCNEQLHPDTIAQRHSRQAKRKAKHYQPKSLYEEQILELPSELIEQADFPALYREVCQHLSLAEARRYSPYLIERLSILVEQAHQAFYRPVHVYGDSALSAIIRFFTWTFPRTVRREINWLWLSSLLFYGPLLAMIIVIQFRPEFVYSVLSPDSVSGMEAMYDPQAEHIGRERGSGSDSKMFGFYIFNNTSIGFRTFASGLLLGIGSLFTLLFNGLHIGAVAGHLTHLGYSGTFWPFVVGHSAFELTAIALSGAAGLKLGFSLLMPGRKSRYQALLDSAKISVRIMGGVAIMFVMAAFIEAYWSSTQLIDAQIKYTVGALLWLLVTGYFAFVGRRSDESSNPAVEMEPQAERLTDKREF